MEVIVKTIKANRNAEFYLYPIRDCHLGSIHTDEDFLRRTVEEIRTTPNAYWIGMGDLADCITPSDYKRWEGKALAEWMKGKEDNIGATQCDKVCEIFSPIWNKCLGLIEGNHEDSIRRYNHYNMMEEILKRAPGVSYAVSSCLVKLVFYRGAHSDRRMVLIHARHGEGSARTSGARALAVLRLASVFVTAHITLMGHLHGQESPDIPQRLVLSRNDKIKAFESVATMTGAWVKAYMQGVPPSYLERWGSPPSVLGCPKITIIPYDETKGKKKLTL